MKLALTVIGGFFALIVLGAGAWIFVTLHFTYSAGERAGYVQKISKRGWLCKTWEGELAMANLPGAMPQVFEFSVRDEDVAHQIERNAGRRVSLSYEQHPGIPTSCFGDTEYFVVKLTPVDEAPVPVPAPALPAPAAPAATAPATPPPVPAPVPSK